MDVLAARLKWLREKNRYSQPKVADEISISKSFYQKIEYDERDPNLGTLIDLANFYKVSTDFLLGVTDKENALETYRQEIKELQFEITRTNMRLDMIRDNTFREVEEEYRVELTHRIHDARDSLNNKLTYYILEYINLPFFNPNNDEIMKNTFPIQIKVTNDLLSYHVELINKDGKRINILKSFDFTDRNVINEQSKQKADSLKAELEDTIQMNISKYYEPVVKVDSFNL